MPPSVADPLAILRRGELGPLYLIHGKESLLVDRAVDLLRERVLDPRTRDFNYELFSGKEAGASKIVQAARTLPMMGRRRLVLVRGVDEMNADELAAMIPYVSAPAAETCLVLVAAKVDLRLKFFTAWKKHGVTLKLDPLPERQLPQFVLGEARARGVQMQAESAQLVCDEIGADLGQLADAVERLAMYVGDRAVTPTDVEAVIATTRQRSVFELCNAIGEGSRERALRTLTSMLSAKESGVKMVALLARHIRQLWTAHELLAKRARPGEFASALGIPPFFVDGIVNQARRFDGASFERMHEALFVTDWALKSSRLDEARILERLVLELTAGVDAKRRRDGRRA